MDRVAASSVDFRKLVDAVLEHYCLDWDGIHGISHWARVLENGLRLAAATGGRADVITLFAVFHDSRRFNDGADPEHGLRGAKLAAEFRGKHFDLDDHGFELLDYACVWHTSGLTDADVSVQCCWDADRLDLGRVWIEPHVKYLCTDVAKTMSIRSWANGRARMQFVPDVIKPLWDRWDQTRR